MDLYNINLQLLRWIAEPERDSSTIRDRYTVDIIRVTKNLYDRDDLTPTVLAILESVLIALGFSDHIPSLNSSAVERAKIEDDRPLTFDFVKLIRSKTKKPVKDFEFMHITEDSVAWQLRLFGEHMDRSMDSSPDSRVSFNPDAWQREVLDCLDQKDCSVLVVGMYCPHVNRRRCSCFLFQHQQVPERRLYRSMLWNRYCGTLMTTSSFMLRLRRPWSTRSLLKSMLDSRKMSPVVSKLRYSYIYDNLIYSFPQALAGLYIQEITAFTILRNARSSSLCRKCSPSCYYPLLSQIRGLRASKGKLARFNYWDPGIDA